MIRFACPGCQAEFTVGDEKAGKTGKCPKCQAAFLIPGPDPADAPGPPPPSPPSVRRPAPPPPPVTTSGASVELAPCPKCQTRLTVSAADLGLNVQCPNCTTTFVAARPGPTPAVTPARAAPKIVDDDDEEDEDDRRPARKSKKPRRRRRDPAISDGFAKFFLCTLYLSPYLLPIAFWSYALWTTVVGVLALYRFLIDPRVQSQNRPPEDYAWTIGLLIVLPVAAIVAARVTCEVLIAVLKIHETLVDIRDDAERK